MTLSMFPNSVTFSAAYTSTLTHIFCLEWWVRTRFKDGGIESDDSRPNAEHNQCLLFSCFSEQDALGSPAFPVR